MCNVVKYWNVGRIFYDQSNKVQKYLSKLHNYNDISVSKESFVNNYKEDVIKSGFKISNTLLLIEHEPVYTAGLRDCLSPEEQSKLEGLGAQYRKVDRGGLATFHGPGQLTAYPVLNLRHFRPSVKWYVCRLEEIAIQTCAAYGIQAARSPNTGVWVNDNKICAIGVHVSRGVTTHGLAINCSTDLAWFDHIIPCGIEGKGVTSISKELGEKKTIEDVLPHFLKSFEEVFNCYLVEMTQEEKKTLSEAAAL